LFGNKQNLNLVKLYEDDICVAVLSKKPTTLCHVIVFPKQHATIIEQVSDIDVGHMFNVCNKISRAMFESLNIQGTNIFVQNGVAAGQEEPHFLIHIVSRMENDGVKLDWQPKQLTEEQMSTIELQYKQFTEGTVFQKEQQEVAHEVAEQSTEEEVDDDDDENYMLKYFDRKP